MNYEYFPIENDSRRLSPESGSFPERGCTRFQMWAAQRLWWIRFVARERRLFVGPSFDLVPDQFVALNRLVQRIQHTPNSDGKKNLFTNVSMNVSRKLTATFCVVAHGRTWSLRSQHVISNDIKIRWLSFRLSIVSNFKSFNILQFIIV